MMALLYVQSTDTEPLLNWIFERSNSFSLYHTVIRIYQYSMLD
jgi:hypothetical protein